MGCRSSKIVDEARDGATPRSVPIVSVDGEILVCTPVPDELDDFAEFGEHNVYACLKYLRDVALDKHEMGSATVDTPCECCVHVRCSWGAGLSRARVQRSTRRDGCAAAVSRGWGLPGHASRMCGPCAASPQLACAVCAACSTCVCCLGTDARCFCQLPAAAPPCSTAHRIVEGYGLTVGDHNSSDSNAGGGATAKVNNVVITDPKAESVFLYDAYTQLRRARILAVDSGRSGKVCGVGWCDVAWRVVRW